jgi:hypothetical protein
MKEGVDAVPSIPTSCGLVLLPVQYKTNGWQNHRRVGFFTKLNFKGADGFSKGERTIYII